MKIRSDFVTNSSSSCFTVMVRVRTQDEEVVIEDNPYEYSPDEGGCSNFYGDLRKVKKHMSSVESLAKWLMSELYQESWYDEEEESDFDQRKEAFVKEACEKIASVDEIETIEVIRYYDAWGEFAELVADNLEMQEYARKYLESTGIEKERAEAEMITYIHTTTDARGDNFGSRSVVSRYHWTEESVDLLAKRLVSNYGPGDVSGVEYRKLDLKTGEYYDESDFNLQ